MKNHTQPLAVHSDTSAWGSEGSDAFNLTNGSELKRTNLDKPWKVDLVQVLDDDAATGEENNELEEQKRVEKAARANRS